MLAVNRTMQECIESAQACRAACQEVLYNHCLDMGGRHIEELHVKLMVDCIEACQLAADFMARNSELHMASCALCAQICDACANSCEQLGGIEMERCASLCRECADNCREMSEALSTA